MLTFGSLFSGIGGFDLGLERAGLECRWQAELDPLASSVLARHWAGVKRYRHVESINYRTGKAYRRYYKPEAVDLICGGFPCQDVSVAGKRKGLAGERSGLWFEFHRILDQHRPRWAVIENVPGLLSSNGGRDFAVILRGLVELGYGVAWRVLDAQYFGLAQRRRRVFIVGSLGDGRAAEILFEREGGAGDTPPRRQAGQGVAPTIESGTNRTGGTRPPGTTVDTAETLQVAYGGNNTSGDIDVATALSAHGGTGRHDFESETFVTNTFNGYTGGADDNDAQGWHLVPALTFEARYARNGRGAPSSVAAPLKAESGQTGKGDGAPLVVSSIVSNGDAHSGFRDDHGLVAHTRRVEGHDASKDGTGRGVPLALMENQRGELRLSDQTDALSTGGGRPGQGYPAALGSMGIRRLMPVECSRLQGFTDDWNEWGISPDGQRIDLSDSARYRQYGNAVAVPCAEWLGRRIVEAARPGRGES